MQKAGASPAKGIVRVYATAYGIKGGTIETAYKPHKAIKSHQGHKVPHKPQKARKRARKDGKTWD